MNHLEPIGHDIHRFRSILGIQLDAIHDLLGKQWMDEWILFVRWGGQLDLVVLANTGRVGTFATRWWQRRWYDIPNEYPVHHGAEVVDIRLWCDFSTTGLLRSNVAGRPLDSWLDRSDGTGLTKIDDPDTQVLENQNIGGLHVRMNETTTMHVNQTLCDLMEDSNDIAVVLGNSLVQGGGVYKLHDQGHGCGLEELAGLDQPFETTDAGMIQLGTNRVFLFRLLDEAIVLLRDPENMLQRPNLLGFVVLNGVDTGSGAVTQMGEHGEVLD